MVIAVCVVILLGTMAEMQGQAKERRKISRKRLKQTAENSDVYHARKVKPISLRKCVRQEVHRPKRWMTTTLHTAHSDHGASTVSGGKPKTVCILVLKLVLMRREWPELSWTIALFKMAAPQRAQGEKPPRMQATR